MQQAQADENVEKCDVAEEDILGGAVDLERAGRSANRWEGNDQLDWSATR